MRGGTVWKTSGDCESAPGATTRTVTTCPMPRSPSRFSANGATVNVEPTEPSWTVNEKVTVSFFGSGSENSVLSARQRGRSTRPVPDLGDAGAVDARQAERVRAAGKDRRRRIQDEHARNVRIERHGGDLVGGPFPAPSTTVAHG